ncbi:MAG: MFS transporter, partial [Myxococcales bacterium]|nr:MFS transporter [Myxococcales bacterium]
TTIGLFGLVAIPLRLKFIWAPFLDRYRLPWLGRRRGWMLLSQLLLFATILILGSLSPRRMPWAIAVVAFLLAFLQASQDIVADAYRTDVLPEAQRASGTAVFVAAYRGALIVAGAGALILSDLLPWAQVYWILGALMGVGVLGTLIAPAPDFPAQAPASLQEAFVQPLVELLGRERVVITLLIVLTYKVGDAFAGHMLTPFLLDLEFSRTQIGAIQKGLGMGASIGGALIGGGLVARYGLRASLIAFGLLQAGANGLYAWLALVGKSDSLLILSIGVDNACNGLGTAAFVAYLMTLCDRRYTAFQYALLSSAMGLLGLLLASAGGYFAETLGWTVFFLISIALGLPAVLLLALHPIVAARPPEASPVGAPCR